ncbi:low density lipoprotein receptor adapter protein 1-like isoform X2 [Sceloporus undulatus]|uniref:low density lipoprotein receptor adapter protein 1-like isoform X2 n=1 Tax=Sceloporus undulatus TaxID=8520 RepID=UPI001C4C66D0|nr:low density lipoprotein receptor adapter protein 1-like isoform X2 [Sceloporus undulatus]
MEALRAAGRAVLRSPSLARHRLAVPRLRCPRSRRRPPREEDGAGAGAAGEASPSPSPPGCCSAAAGPSWSELREPVLLVEGFAGFALKYLGMTLVGEPRGEEMAAAAVRRILATARKEGPGKLRKVLLGVSPRGLSLRDAETRESIESVSIYRISYCTTDKLQNKVFAYVAQNPRSGALECHAFLSPKKKVAQAVTLTVAQAFQMALDLWEAAQAGSREEEEEEEAEEEKPPQRPLCPLEAGPSLGSPPFKADFEEEEEEGNFNDSLASCMEEGGYPTGGGDIAFGSPPAAWLQSGVVWGCSPPSSCLPPGTLF